MENKLPTHRVVLTATSYKDEPNIHVETKWEPLVGDEEIAELGYVPASYQFVDAALEAASMMAQGDIEMEVDDLGHDRVLN